MARDDLARDHDRKKSLLNRRNYLKLAGAAAASVASFGGSGAAAEDDSIILEEDFKDSTYSEQFTSRWVQGINDYVTDETSKTGETSMRVDIPEGEHHGMKAKVDPKDAGLTDQNHQELYVSFWIKFSPNFRSDSNGGKIPGPVNRERNSGGPAGEPADGTNGWGAHGKFGGGDGGVDVGYYTYHMDMSGKWGDHLVAETVPRDEWVKIEQYVRLNTVSGGSANRDGALKMWVNGNLGINRTSMRYTLYPENGINYDMLMYYGGSDPSPADNHVHIDNWKMATSNLAGEQSGDVLELISDSDTTAIEYDFTVDGSVSKRTSARSNAAEGNDSVTRNDDGTTTASGVSGNGDGDSYFIDGTFTAMNLDESKWTIRYQGEEKKVQDLVPASGPAVDRFDVSKSRELGTDRMFSVNWEVSKEENELDVVEVSVVESTNTNFSVNDVSGKSASGWELFQFPVGSEIDVNIRAKDTAGNTTKKIKTVTL